MKDFTPYFTRHPKHWWEHNTFILTKDYRVSTAKIPKGFEWDGATIPRWLTLVGLLFVIYGAWVNLIWLLIIGGLVCLIPVIFPRNGKYLKASLLHDYLLDKGFNRREADLEFKKELTRLKITNWRIIIMYTGVRFFSVVKGG